MLGKVFTDAGMYYIEGCHLGTRTAGKWNSKTFSIFHKDGPLATTREGDIHLAHICKQLMEEIERNGWKERWLQDDLEKTNTPSIIFSHQSFLHGCRNGEQVRAIPGFASS